MARKPKVSILCLTYNHEKFISEALDGFLNQKTSFEFEIVIHDDASTDGTQRIIKEYYSRHPEIIKTILLKKNIHSAGGNILKNAFKYCSGDYIAFCEGDDKWVEVTKLQKQVEFLDFNKDYVLVYSDCIPFNDKGRVEINLNGAKRDLSQNELIGSPSIYTLTTCFRNIIQIPPEASIARYGDLFIWTLLGHYGKGAYLSSVSPPMYRMHEGGMNSMKSNDIKFEMLISTYAAIMMYYRRTGNNECALLFKSKIINSTLKHMLKKISLFVFFVKLLKQLKQLKQSR